MAAFAIDRGDDMVLAKEMVAEGLIVDPATLPDDETNLEDLVPDD